MKTWRMPLTDFFDRHEYLRILMHGFVIAVLIECLNRGSVWKAFGFMTGSAFTFICNLAIITLTLTVSLLFERRHRFVLALLSGVWGILGIVNAVVLRFRMTPFSAEDFNMLPSLLRIADNYLTTTYIVMIAGGIAAALLMVVLLWKKLPRERIHEGHLLMAGKIASICLVVFGMLQMGLQTQAISRNFMNLADAYQEYGFAYCFANSIVDVGMDEPDNYGAEAMRQIVSSLKTPAGAEQASAQEPVRTVSLASATAPVHTASLTSITGPGRTDSRTTAAETVQPNIVMIQLESFFDPLYIEGVSFNSDPIPYFRSLKESCPSGFLTVPVAGAGTANTEFEILTGMSTDYFGAGEYPYNTVLQDTTVESLANVLKKNGYASTAIHNNTGTFYKRHIVFSQMGFERFVPMEYMYDLERTPNKWAKDEGLTDVMLSCMELTEEPDFIYTITVQSHGRYPDTPVLEKPMIEPTCDDGFLSRYSLEYYANMIFETDQMVGDLVRKLKDGEPTVLVLFGDHLPAIGLSGEDLSQPDVYRTEYVIWNNFGWEFEGGDTQAESLGSHVLADLELEPGILHAFHAAYDGTEGYEEALQLLEYDLLYGQGYAYADFAGTETEVSEESEPYRLYPASDLQFGYRDITLTGFERTPEGHCLKGDGFNEYSRAVLGDKVLDTRYVDEHTLVVEEELEEMNGLYVGQFDENLNQLGNGSNRLTDI